ncbi:hypothetical protein [Phytohabitans kaempferiae]|uniref:MFS transporter n=1 Tax=Phytohabitans kaempferiae TaxID=1620943 RepID=A0ABV6M6T1_9ACTN
MSAAGTKAEKSRPAGHARAYFANAFRQRDLWLLTATSGLTPNAIAYACAEVSILAGVVQARAGAVSGLLLALWAGGSVTG